MGKTIIWSSTTLDQLEEIHADILEVSKSLNTSDKFINDIVNSVTILSTRPEIYTLDENKLNNDGSYRSYEIRGYNLAYRVLKDEIRIIRVRYSGKEPKRH